MSHTPSINPTPNSQGELTSLLQRSESAPSAGGVIASQRLVSPLEKSIFSIQSLLEKIQLTTALPEKSLCLNEMIREALILQDMTLRDKKLRTVSDRYFEKTGEACPEQDSLFADQTIDQRISSTLHEMSSLLDKELITQFSIHDTQTRDERKAFVTRAVTWLSQSQPQMKYGLQWDYARFLASEDFIDEAITALQNLEPLFPDTVRSSFKKEVLQNKTQETLVHFLNSNEVAVIKSLSEIGKRELAVRNIIEKQVPLTPQTIRDWALRFMTYMLKDSGFTTKDELVSSMKKAEEELLYLATNLPFSIHQRENIRGEISEIFANKSDRYVKVYQELHSMGLNFTYCSIKILDILEETFECLSSKGIALHPKFALLISTDLFEKAFSDTSVYDLKKSLKNIILQCHFLWTSIGDIDNDVKNTLVSLLIKMEGSIQSGISKGTIGSIDKDRSSFIISIKEEFESLKESLSNWVEASGQHRKIIEELEKQLIDSANLQCDRAAVLDDQLLSICPKNTTRSQVEELLPLLSRYEPEIRSIVQRLNLSPEIALEMFRDVLEKSSFEDSFRFERAMDCIRRKAFFIETLKRHPKNYTAKEIIFLLKFATQALNVYPDSFSLVTKLPKETIADLLAYNDNGDFRSSTDMGSFKLSDDLDLGECFLHLFYGGTLASFVKSEGIPPIPERIFFSKNGVDFINKISPGVSSNLRAVLQIENQPENLEFLYSHPESLPILCQVYEAEGRNIPRNIFQKIQRLFEWIDHPQSDQIPPKELLELDIFLTTEIRLKSFKRFEPRFWTTQMWYDIEASCVDDVWNKMSRLIDKIELSLIPTEILLRFLAERPADEVLEWLHTEALIEGAQQLRISTLSEQQKTAILRRFRQFDGTLPIEKWRKAFRVDPATARELCTYLEHPMTPTATRLQAEIEQNAHGDDPLSLFKKYVGDEHIVSVDDMVLDLLLHAKEVSICGGRRFLVWGTAEATNSLCCAQDGVPLRLRGADSVLRTYFPRGMFNTPTYSVPAYTLHERLVHLETKDPEKLKLLRSILSGDILEAPNDIVELVNEIRRISDQLQKIYPLLKSKIEDGDNDSDSDSSSSDDTSSTSSSSSSSSNSSDEETVSTVTDEEETDASSSDDSDSEIEPTPIAIPEVSLQEVQAAQAQRTPASIPLADIIGYNKAHSWFDLLKIASGHLSRRMEGFDQSNNSHCHAIMFQSLLLAIRNAELKFNGEGLIEVSLNPSIKICLSTVSSSRWTSPRIEDQFEMEHHELRELSGDYFPQTLTALTPQDVSPEMLSESIRHIKDLPEETFLALFASASKIMCSDEDVLSPPNYLDLWRSYWPKEIESNPSLIGFLQAMAKRFYGALTVGNMHIQPRKVYYFDPQGAGQFCDPDAVPAFIRSEGNFASALCKFFTPIEPQRHDGNCGINSVLLDVKKLEEYDEELLRADIAQFRTEIVRLAKEHTDSLVQRFGPESVQRIILEFENEEWANEVVWACASLLYGRQIRVYARGASEVRFFTTDDAAIIEPNAVFNPEGEPKGPPIHLMHWDGAHYCLLKPRAD